MWVVELQWQVNVHSCLVSHWESGKEQNSETCNGDIWLDLNENDSLEPTCHSEAPLSVKVACSLVLKKARFFCFEKPCDNHIWTYALERVAS